MLNRSSSSQPLAVFSASLLALAQFLRAGDAGEPAITDPAQGGEEFQLQGEYAGEKCAAQIIALGDGKFRAVGWLNGLPGDAADAQRKGEIDGELKDGAVTFKNADWDVTLNSTGLQGTNTEGKTITLKKVERKSPTLGMEPPEKALIRFNGKSTEAFVKAELDENGNLKAGTSTKSEFGDFTMHLEFRVPFMPKSRLQSRGNSGIIRQDWFEVQVLDSFGLVPQINDCGALYNAHPPLLNMSYPPLSWQTYDIDYEGPKSKDGARIKEASITVKHNGVIIHDHAQVKMTDGRHPIEFQYHNNPVVYRNVWVVEK
jgi:hypothetical protein